MRRPARGVTLIELMVTVSIAAILMVLALPAMSAYFQNAKLGSAARSYQAGLQTARTEAIRRNLRVEFLLTDGAVDPATAAAAVGTATGRGWIVRTDLAQSPTVTVIETRTPLEGSGQAAGAAPSITVAGTAPNSSPAFAGSIRFDGLGATFPAGAEADLLIANPSGGTCATGPGQGGPMRCLTVKALPSGQVLICDALAVAPDSRAC